LRFSRPTMIPPPMLALLAEINAREADLARATDGELRGPSSTWAYLIDDNVLGGNLFLTLANRASFGLWAVLLCWWLLLPWALVLHWRRWRRRSEPEGEDRRAAEGQERTASDATGRLT